MEIDCRNQQDPKPLHRTTVDAYLNTSSYGVIEQKPAVICVSFCESSKVGVGKKWAGIYHSPDGELVDLQNRVWSLYNCSNTLYEARLGNQGKSPCLICLSFFHTYITYICLSMPVRFMLVFQAFQACNCRVSFLLSASLKRSWSVGFYICCMRRAVHVVCSPLVARNLCC